MTTDGTYLRSMAHDALVETTAPAPATPAPRVRLLKRSLNIAILSSGLNVALGLKRAVDGRSLKRLVIAIAEKREEMRRVA